MPEEHSKKPDKAEEKAILTWGYSSIHLQRHPHNEEIKNCGSVESAYLLTQEMAALNIPDHLTLERIAGSNNFSEEDKTRLEKVWRQLQRHQTAMNENVDLSHDMLTSVPEGLIEENAKIIREELLEAGINIPKQFQMGVSAMISRPENHEDQKQKDRLILWKRAEKNSRDGLQKEHKTYLTALRGYYTMIMELLPCSPHTTELMKKIAMLECIDMMHAAAQASKTLHHQQGKKRLRKTADAPYSVHEIDTAMAAIYDILPHTIKDDNITIDLLSIIGLCAIHDTLEDTELGAEDILRITLRIAHRIDSTIHPYINTKYPSKYLTTAKKLRNKLRRPKDEREEEEMVLDLFHKDTIDLVNGNQKAEMKQCLRVLSNNVELRDREKRKACKSNITGREKLFELLDVTPEDLRMWELEWDLEDDKRTDQRRINKSGSKETFLLFQEEFDKGKLAKFLLKLKAITIRKAEKRKAREQMALIVKLEDRANNIATQSKMGMQYRFNNLRATVTRLLAWCMLDYDEHEEYPLYNALPRIIDNAIEAYKELFEDHPKQFERIDMECMDLLTIWKKEANEKHKKAETLEQTTISLQYRRATLADSQ